MIRKNFDLNYQSNEGVAKSDDLVLLLSLDKSLVKVDNENVLIANE